MGERRPFPFSGLTISSHIHSKTSWEFGGIPPGPMTTEPRQMAAPGRGPAAPRIVGSAWQAAVREAAALLKLGGPARV